MLPGLVRALSLPTERVVLLLQFPRACQLCFLQGGNIGIQSLELIVYDSPFPGITDVLKIFREARHQGLRDILDNIPVQELVFCRILLLLPGAIVYYPQFGCLPVSKHPMKQADCGGTTPYWLGAAQLKAGDSFPVRFENLSHHWKQPLASWWPPIEQWLIISNCCFDSRVVSTPMGMADCRLLADGWMDVSLGSMIWRMGCCPCNLYPLSTLLTNPKEQQGCYSLVPMQSQELPKGSWKSTMNCLRGSNS